MFNQNAGYGLLTSIMMQNGVQTYGKVFVVCPVADSNYQKLTELFPTDADGKVRIVATLAEAYALATSNNNDVILLTANASHTVTSMITWAKNRIHVIGMDGGERITAQGTKVYMGVTTAATDLATIKVTGVRNSFRNIKFISENTKAESLYAAILAGEGNLYKNCSFAKLTDLNEATAADVILGEDSGTFINCEFGFDTLTISAARANVRFNSTVAGARAKDNYFEKCKFKHQSSSADCVCIDVADSTSVLFGNEFESCSFIATLVQGAGIASTIAIASVTGLTDGQILVGYPRLYNINDLSVAGGSKNTGVLMVAPLTVTTAEEAKAPTVS